MSATGKLSVVLNYVLDLSDYVLDLFDCSEISNVLSIACIA